MWMLKNNQIFRSFFGNLNFGFYNTHHVLFFYRTTSVVFFPIRRQLLIIPFARLSSSGINNTVSNCREVNVVPAASTFFSSLTSNYTDHVTGSLEPNSNTKDKNFGSNSFLKYRKTFKLIKNKPLIVQQRRTLLKYIKAFKVLKRHMLEEYKKKLLPRQRRRYNLLPYNLRTTIPLSLKFPKNFTFVKSKTSHNILSVFDNLVFEPTADVPSSSSSAVLESSETVSKVPLLIIPGSSLYASGLVNVNDLNNGKDSKRTGNDLHSTVPKLSLERKVYKHRSSKRKKIDDSSFDYEEKSFDYYRGSTFLTLRPTRNNFFLTLWESSKGRMLINVSSGCVGFSGPDRVSEYAIKLLTLHFLRLVRIKKIRHFRIIVPDGAKSSSNVKRCLGILGEPSSGIRVSFVLHISSRAHNGCRGRKQRRV